MAKNGKNVGKRLCKPSNGSYTVNPQFSPLGLIPNFEFLHESLFERGAYLREVAYQNVL